MSLAGRLEDLSLGDILQIVHLSRRSGTLEIRDGERLSAITISRGLIVAAGASDRADLRSFLRAHGQNEDPELAPAEAIESWISSVVTPLLASARGEFRFVLSESGGADELEYDEQRLPSGGFAPQHFLAAPEVKPLAGLEERMRAGSDFLRGPSPRTDAAHQENSFADRIFSASRSAEAPPAKPADAYVDPSTGALIGEARFTVRQQNAGAGAAVVVFEPDARIRVALRRTLSAGGTEVRQFSAIDEARAEIQRLIDDRRYFVTVADVQNDRRSVGLLRLVKEANHRLPIGILFGDFEVAAAIPMFDPHLDLVVPESESAWADPSALLQRLSGFVATAMSDWANYLLTAGVEDAGQRFFEDARHDLMERRCSLLESLITELTADQDVQSVAQILLRVASEFLDRGAVFLPEGQFFVGAAGFGPSGDGDEVNERVRKLRIARSDPSVLSEVLASGRSHRGKLHRTEANVTLISQLGSAQPTDVAVFPIGTGEGVAGVFYGDNGVHRSPMRELGALEVFLSQAGRALESGTRLRSGRHEDLL
ncbi:MAG: DUF4388 domain-containing protein [Acidobacteriota bacterium]